MSLGTLTKPDTSSTPPQQRRTTTHRRVAFAGLVLAAITAAVVFVLNSRPPEPVLVTDGAGRISLLDLETGEPTFTVTDAVRAPAGETIVRTQQWEEPNVTEIEVVDPKSGQVITTTRINGRLEIRAVSPLGGAVALMSPRSRSAGLYVPEPRETTSITVAWSDGREPVTYSLRGNFEPETFSKDETTLFLLEFFPPTEPDRYFVRQLDLATGDISVVETPDQELGIQLNPEMRGHARAQAMSPDGKYLFSLYTIGRGEDPVHDPEDPEGDRWAFVHTLNLEEKWSHCIFLPAPFGTQAESAMSLGMSGDGKHLFVIDASTEHVARIDARELRVDTSKRIPGLFSQTSRPLAVGPEIVYIGLGQSVLEMGRETLIPNAAFVINTPNDSLPIVGLELAADGRTLRVSHGSSISVIDMPTEQMIATLRSPGDSEESFVGNPFGDRIDLELEWVIPGS